MRNTKHPILLGLFFIFLAVGGIFIMQRLNSTIDTALLRSFTGVMLGLGLGIILLHIFDKLHSKM